MTVEAFDLGTFTYADILVGDVVEFSSGNRYEVTAITGQDPNEYKTYNQNGDLIFESPVETIFIGRNLETNRAIISDLSLVHTLIKGIVL